MKWTIVLLILEKDPKTTEANAGTQFKLNTAFHTNSEGSNTSEIDLNGSSGKYYFLAMMTLKK